MASVKKSYLFKRGRYKEIFYVSKSRLRHAAGVLKYKVLECWPYKFKQRRAAKLRAQLGPKAYVNGIVVEMRYGLRSEKGQTTNRDPSVNLGPIVNSSHNDGDSSLSADGLLYYL